MSHNTKQSSPKSRIESLSDLIFGLALSISALSLLGNPPSSPAEIRSDIIAFAFSFLILISVWLGYTRIMSVLPMETSTTIFLNIILLFLVSIEPYLLGLMTFGDNPTQSELATLDYASVLYAFDLAGLNSIMAFFAHILTIEEKKLISPQLIGECRLLRNSLFFTAALFLLSALPQLWTWTFLGTPVRFYFWFVPLVLTWIRRLRERQTKSK